MQTVRLSESVESCRWRRVRRWDEASSRQTLWWVCEDVESFFSLSSSNSFLFSLSMIIEQSRSGERLFSTRTFIRCWGDDETIMSIGEVSDAADLHLRCISMFNPDWSVADVFQLFTRHWESKRMQMNWSASAENNRRKDGKREREEREPFTVRKDMRSRRLWKSFIRSHLDEHLFENLRSFITMWFVCHTCISRYVCPTMSSCVFRLMKLLRMGSTCSCKVTHFLLLLLLLLLSIKESMNKTCPWVTEWSHIHIDKVCKKNAKLLDTQCPTCYIDAVATFPRFMYLSIIAWCNLSSCIRKYMSFVLINIFVVAF